MAAFEQVRAVAGHGLTVEQDKLGEDGDVIVREVAFRSTPNGQNMLCKGITVPFVDAFQRHAHGVIGHERDLV